MSLKKKILIAGVIMVLVVILASILCAYLYNINNNRFEEDQPTLVIPTSEKGYDFDQLKKSYPDIVGWIDVPNTSVSEPVVKDEKNDSYYLNHSPQKEFSPSGAAYMEVANNSDFSDPVTVIYGHNMNDNKTMFSSLHNFENRQFFDSNPCFYIYTPGHKLTYTVVCAAVTDDRHILNSHNFSDKQIFLKYLNDIKTNTSMSKNVRQDVNLDANSKIVQLSTCMTDLNLGNQRYIVTGVLTDDKETS